MPRLSLRQMQERHGRALTLEEMRRRHGPPPEAVPEEPAVAAPPTAEPPPAPPETEEELLARRGPIVHGLARGARAVGRFARALPSIVNVAFEKAPEMGGALFDPERKSPMMRTLGELGGAGAALGTRLVLPGMMPASIASEALETTGIATQRPEMRGMTAGQKASKLGWSALQLAGFKYLPKLGTAKGVVVKPLLNWLGKRGATALVGVPAIKGAATAIEQTIAQGGSPEEAVHAAVRSGVNDAVAFYLVGKAGQWAGEKARTWQEPVRYREPLRAGGRERAVKEPPLARPKRRVPYKVRWEKRPVSPFIEARARRVAKAEAEQIARREWGKPYQPSLESLKSNVAHAERRVERIKAEGVGLTDSAARRNQFAREQVAVNDLRAARDELFFSGVRFAPRLRPASEARPSRLPLPSEPGKLRLWTWGQEPEGRPRRPLPTRAAPRLEPPTKTYREAQIEAGLRRRAAAAQSARAQPEAEFRAWRERELTRRAYAPKRRLRPLPVRGEPVPTLTRPEVEPAIAAPAAPLPIGGGVAAPGALPPLPAPAPPPPIHRRVAAAVIAKAKQVSRRVSQAIQGAAAPTGEAYERAEPLGLGQLPRKKRIGERFFDWYERKTQVGRVHTQVGKRVYDTAGRLVRLVTGQPVGKRIRAEVPRGKRYLRLRAELDNRIQNLIADEIVQAARPMLQEIRDPKMREQMFRAIEQEIPMSKLPARARYHAENIAARLTSVGQALAREGVIPQSSADKYAMRYIGHYYKEFEPGLRNRMKRIAFRLKGNLRFRPEEIARTKARKFATALEAEKAGLTPKRDAVEAFMRDLMVELPMLEKARFFKAVASEPNWVRTPKQSPKGWRRLKLPGNLKDTAANRQKVYGALGEMYVHPAVAMDIEGGVVGRSPSVPRILRAATSLWKRIKVPYRVAAHRNQDIGNLVFLDLADVPWRSIPAAIGDIRARRKLFREFAKSELLSADYISANLPSVSTRGIQGPEGLLIALESGTARLPKFKSASGLYRWSDLIGRYTMYRWQRLGGRSQARSVEFVNENFPNYKQVPPRLKSLEDTGFGTVFLSFWHEALRIMGKHATTPRGQYKLGKWIAAGMALDQVAKRAVGYSSQELQDARDASHLGPLDPLIGKTEEDEPVFLMMKYALPAGEELEILGHLTRGRFGQAASEGANNVYNRILNHPFFTLGAVAKTGREPFSGLEVWHPYRDPAWAKAIKTGRYVGEELLPLDIGRFLRKARRQYKYGERYKGRRIEGYGEAAARTLLGLPYRVGLRKGEAEKAKRKLEKQRAGQTLTEALHGFERSRGR